MQVLNKNVSKNVQVQNENGMKWNSKKWKVQNENGIKRISKKWQEKAW